MPTLTRHSLRRPGATLLVAVLALLGGVAALRSLPQELLPGVDAPSLTVTVAQPGASPEAVVEDLALPVEEALRAAGGARQVRSTSVEGLAELRAEYDFGDDIDARLEAVRERLSALALPAGVAPPTVERSGPGPAPFYAVAVAGEDMAAADRFAATVLEPALRGVPGVASVSRAGPAGAVVHVVADPVKLAALGTSAAAVADALRAANYSLPAGGLTSDGSLLPVRLQAETATTDEVRALPVALRPGGPPVTVGDVAAVETGESAGTAISRSDGRAAVLLEVHRRPGEGTVGPAVRLRRTVAEHPPPRGVKVTEVANQGPPTRRALTGLGAAAALGAALAAAVTLLFFRKVRPTLVVCTAIPLSLLPVFVVMRAGNVSLGLLTTGALSLAVGRAVTGAIVVVENIVRHLERGTARAGAVSAATAEVAPALLATTVAGGAVLVPVALAGGLVGWVSAGLAVTVAAALGAGLLVAVTAVPVLAGLLLRPGACPAPAEPAAVRRRLAWALDHRMAVAGGAAVLVAISLVAASRLPRAVFPAGGTTGLALTVSPPPGTSPRAMASRLVPLEDRLRTLSGVRSFTTVAGTGALSRTGSARVSIDLTGGADVDGVRRRIETLIPTLSLTGAVTEVTAGISRPDLTVTVAGDDFEQVRSSASAVEQALRGVGGLSLVSTDVAADGVRLMVRVDPARTAAAGLRPAAVNRAVQEALGPMPAGTATIAGEEHAVVVTVDPARFAGDLRELPVGPGVSLGAVADVSPDQAQTAVSRRDGGRVAEVRAVVDNPDTGAVISRAGAAVDRISLPAGVSLELGGLAEVQRSSSASLRTALGLAVALGFLVMALALGRMVAAPAGLLAVPLAAAGAIPALLLSGHVLGVPARLGLVLLVGTGAADAILLMNAVERRRAAGDGVRAALLAGAGDRARPMLMAAAATVAALTPLALGLSEGARTMAAMAVVMIGGTISSTVLTLVVVPVAYSLAADLPERLRAAATRRQARADESAEAGAAEAPAAAGPPVGPPSEIVLTEGSGDGPAEAPEESPALRAAARLWSLRRPHAQPAPSGVPPLRAVPPPEPWAAVEDQSEWAPPPPLAAMSVPGTGRDRDIDLDSLDAWFLPSDAD